MTASGTESLRDAQLSRLRSGEDWGARPEEEVEVPARGRSTRDGVWFSMCQTRGP